MLDGKRNFSVFGTFLRHLLPVAGGVRGTGRHESTHVSRSGSVLPILKPAIRRATLPAAVRSFAPFGGAGARSKNKSPAAAVGKASATICRHPLLMRC